MPKKVRSQFDSETTEHEIVQLYLSGNSIEKIHAGTMIPRDTISSTLHKHGIRMRHRYEIYHQPEVRLNRDVALLLGLHAGDGHLSAAWGISISLGDGKMKEDVISLVRRVLGVEPCVEYRTDRYLIVNSGKEQVREFFKRYGFRRGRKAGIVKVPREVLASKDVEVWIGFLNGAFSSDGSFWFKNNWGQCRFEVSSRCFRDGFIDLARRLGFGFRAYSYVHHAGHNKLPLHLAYLGIRDEVKRWMEEIGSMSDTHLARYQRWSRRIDK